MKEEAERKVSQGSQTPLVLPLKEVAGNCIYDKQNCLSK